MKTMESERNFKPVGNIPDGEVQEARQRVAEKRARRRELMSFGISHQLACIVVMQEENCKCST